MSNRESSKDSDDSSDDPFDGVTIRDSVSSRNQTGLAASGNAKVRWEGGRFSENVEDIRTEGAAEVKVTGAQFDPTRSPGKRSREARKGKGFGFPRVRGKTCPECGFAAFIWQKACRNGHPLPK